jgi:tungstate transport system substrate-binding protein
MLWLLVLVLTAVGSIAGTAFYFRATSKERLIVSTTTSLYDTGLLDAIEAEFEARYQIDLNFISAGTGIAIKHAERGDADLILVHAPSQELRFLTDGIGVNRKIIAYNFFTIVGPETDPAEIQGLAPAEALQKIVDSGRTENAIWISRGDNSGTHSKEKALWNDAGFNWETLSKETSWYYSGSGGMGTTLNVAEEKAAYTLADMGTYLKYYEDDLISLKVLVSQNRGLLNVYSAIAVNPTLHPDVNFKGAMSFVEFLMSEEGQQIIEQHGKDTYGQSLFHPAVKLLKENVNPEVAEWIRELAFFDGYECPPEYRVNYEDLYDLSLERVSCW